MTPAAIWSELAMIASGRAPPAAASTSAGGLAALDAELASVGGADLHPVLSSQLEEAVPSFDAVGRRIVRAGEADRRDTLLSEVFEHEPHPEVVVDADEVGYRAVGGPVDLDHGNPCRDVGERLHRCRPVGRDDHDPIDSAVSEDAQAPDLFLHEPVRVGQEQLEADAVELLLDGVDELSEERDADDRHDHPDEPARAFA